MINVLKNFKQGLLILSAVFSIGAMAVATVPAHAATCVQGNWTYGSSGHCVQNIQLLLNYEGDYFR